jgi:DNA polymerase-3 subunit beta
MALPILKSLVEEQNMHIRIDRDVFFKAFLHGQGVIERKTSLLILGNTLIQATNGSVTMVSTDMDVSLSESVNAEILSEGSVCIPTVLTYEILRKLKSNSVVEIMFDDSMAHVAFSAGRSKFEIPCVSADEFPRILQDKSMFSCNFSLHAPILRNMIETVRFAMSNDEMRYSLNGIHLSYTAQTNKLRAVATDRHRLACVEIEAPQGASDIPSIIMGKKIIGEFSKLLEEAVEPVSVSVSETKIELSAKLEKSEVTISSRLIDGSFPEYEAVLNIQHDKKIIAGAVIFEEAVDRVGTIINDKSRVIKLHLSRNLVHLSAVGGTSGIADEDVDVDYDDETALDLNFDVIYLLDVAQHVSTDDMEISLSNSDMAISVRPVGLEGVYFALMPLAPQAQYSE